MNTPIEPKAEITHPQVDEKRRRLAKGGLAAPIVLGTLLSRPVLGATYHNCTISGQMSGNVSTHEQGVCSTLGSSPSTYAAMLPSSWPNATEDFLNRNGKPRNFPKTPASQSQKFVNAFERYDSTASPPSNGSPSANNTADVLEVLQGDWDLANANRTIRVRLFGGFDTTNGLALGKEAVAAYMNAFDQTKYPLTQAEVVAMFNAVIHTGGIYDPLGVNWDASQVLAYFTSLHS